MKQLYAPWREDYSHSVAETKNENSPQSECVFCNHFSSPKDEQHFILRRFNTIIVMLNLYPYNAGHLLLLPKDHVASLEDLSSQTRTELIELTTHSSKILKKVLECDGLNVGLNLGKAAGAGIPSHLHMHVLPRFIGDTNFLPTLAHTKAISFDLIKIYNQLKPEFANLTL